MRKELKKNRKGFRTEGEMTAPKPNGYNTFKDIREAAARVNDAVNDYLLPIVTDYKVNEQTRADVATATVELQIAMRWLEGLGAGTRPIRLSD